MLELQSRGVNDETEWLEFVTSEVELVHPITPYRSCSLPHRQSTDCVLVGTQALVRDMISILVCLGALRKQVRGRAGPAATCLVPCLL